jgi:hypothetical protein
MEPIPSHPGDDAIPYWRPSVRLRWALGITLVALLVGYLGLQAPRLAAFVMPASTPPDALTGQVRYHFAALAPISVASGAGGATTTPGVILSITWIAVPQAPATVADGKAYVMLRSLLIGPYASLADLLRAMDASSPSLAEAVREARVASAPVRAPLISDAGAKTLLVLPPDLPPGWYRHIDFATTTGGTARAERSLLVEPAS